MSHSSMKQIFDFGILGEKEVEIEYSYSPGTPDVWYLPNGDPGYPGDPAELIIYSATMDGIDLSVILAVNDHFLTTVMDEVAAYWESDEAADRADYENDQRRERELDELWEKGNA